MTTCPNSFPQALDRAASAPGTASLWWCLPDTGWRCVECVEPPNPAEDDRARLAYGLAAPLPDDPTPATETDHVR